MYLDLKSVICFCLNEEGRLRIDFYGKICSTRYLGQICADIM
jgi:hypothetical protein